MKILQVVSYGYFCGGAEKSVLLLKQGLTRAGHDVRVLSSDAGEPAERFSEYVFPQISPRGLGKYAYHLWYPRAYKALAAAIKDFQPDIVHFHTMGELSPAALFALQGVPAVMTVHGPEEYMPSMMPWTMAPHYFKNAGRTQPTIMGKLALMYCRLLQRPIYLRGLKHVQAIIAPHAFIAQKIKGDRLGPELVQIWNGIALPPHAPVRARHQLIFIGRLEAYKGVKYLLEAVQKLRQEIPSVQLSVLGDGPERKALEQYVRERDLAQHVTFTGWLPNDEVFARLQAATVVAIPSTVPELPTVCFEALAVGRPVVGTNLGAIPEVITPKTGKIIPPADAQALADALASYMRLDLPALQATAEACSASAQRFSVETFVRQTTALYQDTLAAS